MLSRARSWRIRSASKWLVRLGSWPPGARAIVRFRRLPGGRRALRSLTGYRSTFTSFQAAEDAIAGVANGGHENPMMAKIHLNISTQLRPSDYPVLYHLRPIIQETKRIFDVGGSVGNLYYAYTEYLDLPSDLQWQVHDLPSVVAAGRELACRREARRLAFTDDWNDADGADLLIASGSAHYFETPLPRMIADLRHPPPFVVINRTPLYDGPTIATTQDGLIRIACMLYNRQEVIHAFQAAGYQLVDQWQALEASLHIPGYPDYSVPHYSGMFFRKKRMMPTAQPRGGTMHVQGGRIR